jgi:hypothetical protein
MYSAASPSDHQIQAGWKEGKKYEEIGKEADKKKIKIIMPRSLNTKKVPLPKTELFKPRDIRIRRGRAKGRGW